MTKLLVDPDSVAGNGLLRFVSRDIHYTTMLYEIADDVVPDWFGVAIADNVTDFAKPTIYFHPRPGPAGYVDGRDSKSKVDNHVYYGKKKIDPTSRSADETKWHELYEYVHILGQQLAGACLFGASANQIVIFPFMTDSVMVPNTTAGMFPEQWLPIVTDILSDVAATVAGKNDPLTISEVVLGGFSFGYACMHAFRTRATQSVLRPLLKQVLYFDGSPKPPTLPELVSIPGTMRAIKYSEGSEPHSIALPTSRWLTNYPNPVPPEEPGLPGTNDVHHLIRNFMFFDAALKRTMGP